MPDQYRLNGSTLDCYSSSGKVYHLTVSTCTCVGFSYRRTCRHFKNAWTEGYMTKLKKSIQKNSSSGKLNSPFITEGRKESLRQFFAKNNVKVDEQVIERLEPKLTRTGPALDKLIKAAKTLMKRR